MKLNFTINNYTNISNCIEKTLNLLKNKRDNKYFINEKCINKEWTVYIEKMAKENMEEFLFLGSFKNISYLLDNYTEHIEQIKNGINEYKDWYFKDYCNAYNLSSYFDKITNNLETKDIEKVIEFVNKIMQSNEFELFNLQTIEYMNKIEKIWNLNYLKIYKHINKILEVDLFEIDVIVNILITNNQYNNGCFLGNTNGISYITWGNTKSFNCKFPYYDVVYITHELLHIIYPSDDKLCDNYNIIHAYIQLMADNELFNLFAQKPYFTLDSHQYLEKTQEFLYPYWIGFIYRNSPNIKESIEAAFERDNRYVYDAEKIANFFKDTNITFMDMINIENNINLQKLLN